MTPPLISEYKKGFALKRILQSFLGGLRIFSLPILIIVQLIIFILPGTVIIFLEFVIFRTEWGNVDNIWKACISLLLILIIDILLSLIIFVSKREPRVHVSYTDTNDSHFLSQEDNIDYQGLLKSSTWISLTPNINAGASHLIAIFCSSFAFAFATPLVIHEETSIVLRIFALFALCNARFSSTISIPPEIATFDAIRRKDLFYRSFYTFIIGLVFFINYLIDAENTNFFAYNLCLAILPVLWTLGILPPMDALGPWFLEWILRTLGGSPSYFYTGTVLGLILLIFCTVFVFIVGQDHLFILLLQCVCGYIISCDAGLLLKLKASFCEDIPTISFIIQILKPSIKIAISLLCVLIVLLVDIEKESERVLSIICLTNVLSTWIIRKIIFSIKNFSPPEALLIAFSIWDGILTFILHVWISIEINLEQKPRALNSHSLIYLISYALTIRAFSVSIKDPKFSAIDLTLTALIIPYFPEDFQKMKEWSFPTCLLIVALLRLRFIRMIKYCKMMIIFFNSAVLTPLIENKLLLIAMTILTFPISIISMVLASMIEGATLVPIFTLPIFLLAFPRPTSYFKEHWLPKSNKEIQTINNESKSLDWTIYSDIAPNLIREFVRKCKTWRMKMEEGRCYLARYEDRLIFYRVVTSSWNNIYINVKGLEMQEQTSCHNQEAAWIDELFDNAFNPEIKKIFNKEMSFKSLLSSVVPLMNLSVLTYNESKSKIDNLNTPQQISVFRKMFFRSFSFLLMKNSPEFKRRPIASGYQLTNASPSNTMTFVEMFGNNEEENDDSILTPIVTNIDNRPLFTFSILNENPISTNNSGNGETDKEPSNSNQNPVNNNSTISNEIKASNYNFMPTSTLINNSNNNNDPFPYLPGMDAFAVSNELENNTKNNVKNKNYQYWQAMPSLSFSVDAEEALHNNENPSMILGRSSDYLNPFWVKKCLGEMPSANIIQGRVGRFCKKAWKLIMGSTSDLYEIDLGKFFKPEFFKEAQKLTKEAKGKGNIEELIVKAFRYASKLTLDEIYNTGEELGLNDDNNLQIEEDIFGVLIDYEKDYKFCSPTEIAQFIEDHQKCILSMDINESGDTQLRIFRFDNIGVDFKIGEISNHCVEGIWGTLNLELLYLTSDDDERYSIQHDRYLIRNICTQCANQPLGYSVYDSTFRINQFDFTVEKVK